MIFFQSWYFEINRGCQSLMVLMIPGSAPEIPPEDPAISLYSTGDIQVPHIHIIHWNDKYRSLQTWLLRICICMYVCIYIYINMYVHLHIYMYIYIHMYIHAKLVIASASTSISKPAASRSFVANISQHQLHQCPTCSAHSTRNLRHQESIVPVRTSHKTSQKGGFESSHWNLNSLSHTGFGDVWRPNLFGIQYFQQVWKTNQTMQNKTGHVLTHQLHKHKSFLLKWLLRHRLIWLLV